MEFEERLVAYIDILGFKDKVEKAVSSPDDASKLHKALSRILSVKEDNYASDSFMEMKSMGVEVNTFSDCAVISYPASNPDNLFFLIMDLIHLQLDLACQDVLLRGGLTVGPLYHDENIVYGTAMNNAYLMESRKAVVPRILVDKKAIEEYRNHFKNDNYSLQDMDSLLRKDADGEYCIDMLHQDQELTDYGTEYYEWLKRLRAVICQGLSNPDIKVVMKYRWLKEYFNEVVTDAKAFYPIPQEEPMGNSNEFRKMYTRLKI